MALPSEVAETQIKRLRGKLQEALPEDLYVAWDNIRTHKLSSTKYVSGGPFEGKLWTGLVAVLFM